jgi:hypothetical protein
MSPSESPVGVGLQEAANAASLYVTTGVIASHWGEFQDALRHGEGTLDFANQVTNSLQMDFNMLESAIKYNQDYYNKYCK